MEEDIIIENQNIKNDKKTYDNIDFDKFSIDKQIGDGSFCIIYLVHHNKSKKKFLVKK